MENEMELSEMAKMTYEQSEIKERLQWLIKLRWAGCVGVLVGTHIVREIAGLTFPLIPVYLILGLVAIYNAYFQVKLKVAAKDFHKSAIEQISLDFLILAGAIYFSGGCDSPFLYYYLFHIVISGILLPRVWTYRFAVLAIVLPTSIVGLKHFGILPHFAIFRNEPLLFSDLSVMAAYGGVFASTLLLTAYFVTYLSDKLYKKQEEIRRLYILSEKLRSSIVISDVIETVKEELQALSGSARIIYIPLNKSKLALVYTDTTSEHELTIPLADRNAFTDTLLSCEAHILETRVISSEYEDKVIKSLMDNPKEIAVLPVRAAFTTKCYEFFHCPDDTGCAAYGSEDRRCWHISGTHCHGRIMRNVTEKLKECLDCDMFAPVGIFVLDMTRKSKLELRIDIDACMRLLDAASLAVSNAKLYEKTLELSEIDGLTLIKNRRTLLKQLGAETQRAHRYKKTFGLLMLDIDHFKHYNDTNGHPQGDILLKMIADMISENLRDTDTVGRYGGEEFIILLPESDKEEAISIAERIRKAVDNYKFPRAETQPNGKMTVSVGVSSYPDDGDAWEKIIRSADDALYVAKNTGRNRVIAANRPEALI
ncbi:MAG: GGDEF domain-containing protein [Nitrospirae bacterium]|nr:GGDEF domain-containing protein [Nitrospirota bacterium]